MEAPAQPGASHIAAPAQPSAPNIAAPAASSLSHVRTVSEHARRALADGVARSATICRLVAEINASDVIVFIDTRVDPDIPTAETMLLTTAATVRYVHVILNPRMMLDERLEYLGHELQHVVEIANDAAAVDSGSVRRRFNVIGRELAGSAGGQKAYETDAAQRVTVAVRRELSRSAPRATGPR